MESVWHQDYYIVGKGEKESVWHQDCFGKALLCGCRGITLPGQPHKISSLRGRNMLERKMFWGENLRQKVVNIYKIAFGNSFF